MLSSILMNIRIAKMSVLNFMSNYQMKQRTH